jgi:DNA (cytosine-5)-methyltransferase 1
MKVLSLFSGVGGFDLGLEAAGMETVFQCEWDKHATNILEKHWPHVPRWGDISTLTGKHILAHAPVIDVVAWGSPCQDLSVAGKRAGLEGSRSGLFHEGVRIIKELRKETNNEYPRISIWENVYGALNSNRGADFGVILNEMAEAGALVQEWRVLDAQYFGVPQRRRRVFLISIFDTATATRCPDPLLPVSEGVQWHPATSHQTRQTVAGEVGSSLASGRDIANTIGAELYHKSTVVNQDVNNGHLVVGSLAARDYKGVGNQYVNEGKVIVEPFTKSKQPQTATDDETWVANQPNPTLNAFDQGDTRTTTVIVGETVKDPVGTLQARVAATNHESIRDGHAIIENVEPVIMRQREGKPGGGKGPLLSNDKSLTLSGSNDQTLFTPVQEPMLIDGTRVNDVRVYDSPVQTLKSRMGTGGNNVPVIGFSHTQSDHQGIEGRTPTLKASGDPVAVAFTTEQTPKYNEDVALTLTKGSPSGGGQPQAVAYDEYNDTIGGEVHHALRAGTKQSTGVMIGESVVAPSLTASNDPSRSPQSAEITQQVTAIHQATMAVRRLTPLECERLMGWPDNWTATKADGTPQSDTHRYKQCGNGVASPVAQWIAQQLLKLNTP